MKFLVVFAVCVAVAAAASVGGDDKTAETIKQVKENHDDGSYEFSFETRNGITQQETGKLKTVPDVKEQVLVKEGDYTYSSPDGPIHVHYIADETGFHPTGEHLKL